MKNKDMMEKQQPPLIKDAEGFIIKLNRTLYKEEIIKHAILGDEDWVNCFPLSDDYYQLRFETVHESDVLHWINYLIYLHKA